MTLRLHSFYHWRVGGLRPVDNPPNPWEHTRSEWLDAPPIAKLEVFEEKAKTVLSENDSPDVGFRWSLNPYRGCFHACAYCYAYSSRIRLLARRNFPA